MIKLVTVEFDLMEPCREEFNLDLKEVRNVVIMYDEF
jgi:hypothetical protein